ncbi:aminoimidazole riboside kinase [Rummeliibacillus sp. JY-2-4R]
MNGILCLGEALIDFIPMDADQTTYQKAPGGAPANVAVGIAKLGGDVSFLGKVGDDILGRFLKETLTNYGVKTNAMMLTDEARTGLTFVTLDASFERDFSFYINPSADRFLTEEEVTNHADLFKVNKILHIGSISQISEPSKTATFEAIKQAKNAGMLISYDPNYREMLWKSKEQAKMTMLETLSNVDILKVSEEELFLLTGCNSIEKGMAALPELPLILVTLGDKGCMYRFNGKIGLVPTKKFEVVDTTGAGDAFVSGILYSICEWRKPLEELTAKKLIEMIRFANVSGGIATTKKGAMTGLPVLEEVKWYLHENDRK